MHLLQRWLQSSQEFDEGITYLKTFGGSETWIKLFERLGETTYTRIELYRQINTLLIEIESKYIPQAKEPEEPEKTLVRPHEQEDAPAIIKDVREQRKQKFKYANQLHYSMVLHAESMLTSNKSILEDPKKTVFELRNLLSEIDQFWDITDKYDATRELPRQIEKVTVSRITDLNRAADRRRTLKVYLMPSYLKRIPEDRRIKFEAETKAELEELELLLSENEIIKLSQ